MADEIKEIRYQKLRTFGDRAPDLAVACVRHDMVDVAAGKSTLPQAALDELWVALVADRTPVTMLDEAVANTLPRELLPLLRVGDDLPAAAAFVLAAQALQGVMLTDDLALSAALEPVWRKLGELSAEADDVEEGFGCDRAEAWRTVRSVRERGGPAFMRKMTEIASLAGRIHVAMSRVAGSAPTSDPHEVVGVEQGRRLEHLMPAEHARLADPVMGDQQAMRILRGQADVRQLQGRAESTRGALVLLIDESGSMHDEAGQTGRNTWAKAAALALARIALGEGRGVWAVHFGTATTTHRVRDQQGLLDMCMSFVGGGTAFVPALRVAAAEATKPDPERIGADVVCITDGQQEVDNRRENAELTAVLDEMAVAGVRLWTVGIGLQLDPTFPLRARAERYVYAHDQDLRLRSAAVNLAVGLTGAATRTGRDLN